MRRVLLRFLAIFSCVVPSALKADVILDWNALMMDGIRTDNTGPTLSTRNLTLLHVAIYDAVMSIERTHQPYLGYLNAPEETSAEAAAVGAAYEITGVLYPSLRGRSDDLYATYLAAQPASLALTNGLALGRESALRILTARAADGSQTEVPYIPSAEPGQWRRTPPFFRPPLTPHWRYVDLFAIPSLDPFLPPPPPALNSPEYAEALNAVKAIGGKVTSVRTAEQSQIAVFWSDFSYTSMPPGHWHLIAASIAREYGNSLAENARLFALISLAQADAAILCWEVKFRYNLWRPVTAIQRADEDGNDATIADKSWDHLLGSPPFPAYTSGHSSFSKASAEVLTEFYGTDAIRFTATSDSLPGVFRTFDSLAACADEVGMSRIYGGIHFPFDNAAGKSSGGAIGRYIARNFFLPQEKLPLAQIERVTDGIPTLLVHGHVGVPCALEVSQDLVQWQTLMSDVAVPGGTPFRDTNAPLAQARFYRVREGNP